MVLSLTSSPRVLHEQFPTRSVTGYGAFWEDLNFLIVLFAALNAPCFAVGCRLIPRRGRGVRIQLVFRRADVDARRVIVSQ